MHGELLSGSTTYPRSTTGYPERMKTRWITLWPAVQKVVFTHRNGDPRNDPQSPRAPLTPGTLCCCTNLAGVKNPGPLNHRQAWRHGPFRLHKATQVGAAFFGGKHFAQDPQTKPQPKERVALKDIHHSSSSSKTLSYAWRSSGISHLGRLEQHSIAFAMALSDGKLSRGAIMIHL